MVNSVLDESCLVGDIFVLQHVASWLTFAAVSFKPVWGLLRRISPPGAKPAH